MTTGGGNLRIHLGAGEAGAFDTGVPVLDGASVENLFGASRPAGRRGAFDCFQSDDWLLGAASAPAVGLEEATRKLYADLLQATTGWHLARIWNYVPAINQCGADALENYRAFCQGRSLAFAQHHGRGFQALLPAASAVGNQAAALTVVFAACPVPPRHVENPLQVSAYDYPGTYGPRAPSFARATVVPGPRHATVFVSGTAAIRGHATVAPHHLAGQLECTIENLRGISRACGLGSALDLGGSSQRHFKVYLRHAADQPAVAAALARTMLASGDRVLCLQADMCRAPLLVEIEVSLFAVTSVGA